MEQYRQYDEERKTLTLDEQYLFAYHKGDGFSHRLLNADFLLDYEYNYTLKLEAFQHKRITTNKSDFLIEKGQLEGKELEFIENLLSADYDNLKKGYDYDGLSITDIGMQQVFINLGKKTKYVWIMEGLSIESFKTPVEKKLYELNEHFKELIETKYNKWINYNYIHYWI